MLKCEKKLRNQIYLKSPLTTWKDNTELVLRYRRWKFTNNSNKKGVETRSGNQITVERHRFGILWVNIVETIRFQFKLYKFKSYWVNKTTKVFIYVSVAAGGKAYSLLCCAVLRSAGSVFPWWKGDHYVNWTNNQYEKNF